MIIVLFLILAVVLCFSIGYQLGKASPNKKDPYLDKYVEMQMQAAKEMDFNPVKAQELQAAAASLYEARFGSEPKYPARARKSYGADS